MDWGSFLLGVGVGVALAVIGFLLVQGFMLGLADHNQDHYRGPR
jgi:hypothetical protein